MLDDILIIKSVSYLSKEVKEYFASHDVYECAEKYNCTPNHIHRISRDQGFKLKRKVYARNIKGTKIYSLCFDKCPIILCVKCPWFNNLRPVKGWEVEPTTQKEGKNEMHSYNVKKCPIYDKYIAAIKKGKSK